MAGENPPAGDGGGVQGAGPSPMPMREGSTPRAPPRLLCDHMLGSLTRWLRFLGIDVSYSDGAPDGELLAAARAQGRFLLTRDKQLAERAGEGGMLVRSVELRKQLQEVRDRLELRFDEELVLSRCSRCNGVLESLPRDEVRGKVPPAVLERQEEFWKCPLCGQLYWPGTHYDGIVGRLNELLARATSSGSPGGRREGR